MNDLETLAARARIVKKRLLKHRATSVKVTVIHDGHEPGNPDEPGMAVKIEVGPYLGVAALEALADELDRRAAGEVDGPRFPIDGIVSA